MDTVKELQEHRRELFLSVSVGVLPAVTKWMAERQPVFLDKLLKAIQGAIKRIKAELSQSNNLTWKSSKQTHLNTLDMTWQISQINTP